jgi:type II secretory ATPase GspE/PulE/Tfp pilus assembly ATPase PilB-like protein
MRLVRRLCPECRTEGRPAPQLLTGLPIPEERRTRLAMAAGCDACGRTGYQGRTGIYEVLTSGEMLRGMLFRERPFAEMTRAAAEDGLLRPLKDVAVEKVLTGETSVEEIAALVY